VGAFGRLIERINRWLQPAAAGSGVETQGGSPGASGTSGATAGVSNVTREIEEETSTNAQPEGASDEPWPRNSSDA
jgi:hypothetical protein